MPAVVDALRNGFVFTSDELPKTKPEVDFIDQDHAAFLKNYLEEKSTPYVLEDGTVLQKVPSTTWWFVDNQEFLGRISIRHYLSDSLLQSGGHVGYSIRPDKVNKGYATEMLKQSFILAKNNLKLDKLLLVVNEDNPASIKVIEKVGGTLEDIRICPYDKVNVKRYWITL